MAFQQNAFQNNSFQVIKPHPGTAGGSSGGRGYGRIIGAPGETYYPFGKKGQQALQGLEKKKRNLEAEIRAVEAKLRKKKREEEELERQLTDRDLSFIQKLKQKLLELYEQLQALEAELAWLKSLRESHEESEMMEVYEVYMMSRLH